MTVQVSVSWTAGKMVMVIDYSKQVEPAETKSRALGILQEVGLGQDQLIGLEIAISIPILGFLADQRRLECSGGHCSSALSQQ